jgi:hypothetical protein
MDTRSESVELKLVRDGFRNYLQIDQIEVREEQYETQMMLQNDLSYFLKLEIRGINQERKYCYCINSKQSLKRVLELKTIRYEELREILLGLLSALQQLKEYCIEVPRDISVTGFDNIMPTSTSYFLTTAKQDFIELGRVATQILLNAIETPSNTKTTTYIDCNIIVRKSVKII